MKMRFLLSLALLLFLGCDDGTEDIEPAASGSFLESCVPNLPPLTVEREVAQDAGSSGVGYHSVRYVAYLSNTETVTLTVELFEYIYSDYEDGRAPAEKGTFPLTEALLAGPEPDVVIELFDGSTQKRYTAVPNSGTLTIEEMPNHTDEWTDYAGCIDVEMIPVDEIDSEEAPSCTGRLSFCWSTEYQNFFC